MELQTYIAIFWRRKWVVLALTLLGLLLSGIATFLATPIYTSTTTLRVATVGANVVGGRSDIDYTQRLMNTYANIINSRSTYAEIMRRLTLERPPTLLVTIVPNTELMRISAEATDPQRARDVATAAAAIAIQQSQEALQGEGQTTQEIINRQLLQIEAELHTARDEEARLITQTPTNTVSINAIRQSIELKERTYATLLTNYENARIQEALKANSVFIVEPADTPARPSKPRASLNLLLGVVVGFFAGVILSLLIDSTDATLYTPAQIEAVTGLATLGRIPAVNGQSPLIDPAQAGPAYPLQLEAFRRLRVNLLSPALGPPPQAVLVTSADAGEGKSTVTANLAIAFAKSGRTVVVIDCDLHMPTQHTLFRLPNEYGLSDALTHQVSVDGVLQRTEIPNVHLITSGPLLPDRVNTPELVQISPSALANRFEQGAELLGSPEMTHLIHHLREEYDIILLDTPALFSVTDAAVLAPLVDRIILVVASEVAHREAVHEVIDLLSSLKAQSIGVVINRDRQALKKKYTPLRTANLSSISRL
jgi:succinoglycan biosynthesis transport protein ExoP